MTDLRIREERTFSDLMRIAIDLTATPKSKTGIGRYMLGLLKGLQETDDTNEYYLFAQDDDLDGFGIYKDNFHFVPVRSSLLRKTYLRIVWEQVIFPFRLKKLKIDLLHCPNYTMPYTLRLVSPKTAVQGTFHDMTYFIHPEYLIGWKCRMFQRYIKKTAKRADKILTISENSKKDIPDFCDPRNPDIAVTYMGVKEAFFDSEPATDEILSKYGIEGEYMLYVGTLEPRKNIPGLIRGYKALPKEIRSRYKLVITGKKGWYYDEIFDLVSSDEELKERVIFTGFVDDQDMMPIMKRAKVFAYISFYEGFGIPVIEGMASSVPTVTSCGSSLEEVAGDCCYLCDPKDVNSIAKALEAASVNRDDTVERALLRAKGFSWKSCAEATLKSYEDAVRFKREA